jgi:transcription termination factor Rho
MSVAEDIKNGKRGAPTEAEHEQVLIKKELQKRRVKKIVDAIERPAVSLPDILTLKERLALPLVETAWRIADLQAAGHRVLLAAQFKAGKTTFVVNVIRSVVDGDPFLNRYVVSPIEGTVALFDFEMSGRQLDDWYRVHRTQRAE